MNLDINPNAVAVLRERHKDRESVLLASKTDPEFFQWFFNDYDTPNYEFMRVIYAYRLFHDFLYHYF